MKKLAVIVATATALIAPIHAAAPAQAAPPSVTFTVTSGGLEKGNAATTGQADYTGFLLDVSTNVGSRVVARVNVNYGGIAPGRYLAKWYACPERSSALAQCSMVMDNSVGGGLNVTQNGSADGKTFEIYPQIALLGKFLKLNILVSNANNESGTYTSSGDMLVFPVPPKGSPATFAAAPVPGTAVNVDLKAWQLGDRTSFKRRDIAAYSCPAGANPNNRECVDVSAGLSAKTANSAAATTVTFTAPAGSVGRTLYLWDTMVVSWQQGATTESIDSYLHSAATTVGVTPSPSPSASPSPSPSPSASIQIPVNPSARPGAAGQFRIAVISKPEVTRGARLKVTVSTSSGASIGEAVVQIKKRPTAKAGTKQTLKRIDVVNGTGQAVNTISRRLPKGSYFLVATYVDDKTKRKTIGTAPLTIK